MTINISEWIMKSRSSCDHRLAVVDEVRPAADGAGFRPEGARGAADGVDQIVHVHPVLWEVQMTCVGPGSADGHLMGILCLQGVLVADGHREHPPLHEPHDTWQMATLALAEDRSRAERDRGHAAVPCAQR